MWLNLLFLCILTHQFVELEASNSQHWAVLVAGSNGWTNYRHQADVSHAYQVLLRHGIPKNNIITMMYDDVASSIHNRYPGQLFHDYEHNDVYRGVKVDYWGTDVTPQTFLGVLLGDRDLKAAGKKVLESGPNDDVFIYFTDHGAPNLIAFPSDVLHADELNSTLVKMYQAKRYKKMLFYLEACFGGSMFEKILSPKLNILAITAANSKESSWACFCDDPKIDTCLADEFSYRWIVDSEQRSLTKGTVAEQIGAVTHMVQQSHVMHYGDWNISVLPLSEFQAEVISNGRSYTKFRNLHKATTTTTTSHDSRSANQAHLVTLTRRLSNAQSSKQMQIARQRLHRTLELGKLVRETVDEIVGEVTSTALPSHSLNDIHTHLQCYKTIYQHYQVKCFSIQQVPELAEELQKFNRLCEAGYETKVIVQAIFDTCA